MSLLEPELMARLEALQLGTRRRLAGVMAGEHRSTRRGTSLDFADYRQYHPGDDYRRIDYHLYARLDVLLLKLYEAEEDLQLRLLIDTSASMATSSSAPLAPDSTRAGAAARATRTARTARAGAAPRPARAAIAARAETAAPAMRAPTAPPPPTTTKLRQASQIAAALGFVSLVNRDPVSVHTFPLDRPAPRFLGRAAVPSLLAHLESLEPAGTTEFSAAVSHLLARPGPPGLTVVLSDLLTPQWESALSRLPARGSDVVIVHVLAPGDLEAPGVGDIEVVDRETGARVAVSVTPETAAQYRQLVAAWRAGVEQRCRQVGAAYLPVVAGDALEPLLLGAWRQRGALR